MAVLLLLAGLAITAYALMELAARPSAGFGQALWAALTRREERPPAPAAGGAMADDMLAELLQLVRLQQEQLREQGELIAGLKKEVESLASEEKAAAGGRDTGLADSRNEEVLTLHRDIYRLHDQGVPLVEIARQVGRGKGEVKLVLGLRK